MCENLRMGSCIYSIGKFESFTGETKSARRYVGQGGDFPGLRAKDARFPECL